MYIPNPLGNNTKVPESITAERLQYLASKIQMLTSKEIEEIIQGHVRLAISVASRMCAKFPNLVDVLVPEALFVLTKSVIEAPSKLKNTDLSAFIYYRIWRHLKKAAHNTQILRVPYSTAGTKLRLGESVQTFKRQQLSKIPSHKQSTFDLKESILALARTQFDKQIIELRIQGYNDTEISSILAVSASSVYNARIKLKERYNEAR